MKLFNILWQSAFTSARTNIQLYTALHVLPNNSFLFDFTDLTFSRTHKFCFCKGPLPFGAEIYLSTFTTFHFIFRLIEPQWLIVWGSVVAHWYFMYILSHRVISSAFVCVLCHCLTRLYAVQTQLKDPVCSLACHIDYAFSGPAFLLMCPYSES